MPRGVQIADVNRINNPSAPVYPVRPGKPVKERESPPRRSPQGRNEQSNVDDEGQQDGSKIDELA
jgi:hypothetical protein